MKTYLAKKKEIVREWYFVDAQDKILGRLATKIAMILKGKHKPTYTPGVDAGDYVVVVNAERIRVTGTKLKDKMYKRYSGYPDGLKMMSLETMLIKKPEDVIGIAVRNMLSRTTLSRQMLKKLKIFRGPNHPFSKIKFIEVK